MSTPLRLLLPLATLLAACSNTPEPTPQSADMSAGEVDMSTSPADMSALRPQDMMTPPADMRAALKVRVATYNTSLFRPSEGQLLRDLQGGEDAQARRIAQVIQRVRPDIVLLNEFDYDASGEAASVFAEQYLAVAQQGSEAVVYAHRYAVPSNTGVHSGEDLDGNGRAVSTKGSRDYGNDAFGYGVFPGQYAMVILSKYPIESGQIRTFQELLWQDMPGNLLPTEFYSPAAAAIFRLSSKNHVDVPIDVQGRTLHLLASHPTPPSFDGAEDRNGKRNHDEVRFWSDYLTGGEAAAYIKDDAGVVGGLEEEARFVIVGDLNTDPVDGDSLHEAIKGLLGHARVQDVVQESLGAVAAATKEGGANAQHRGEAARDTANFSDARVGNLRVDYALPSKNMSVIEGGVYWPAPESEEAAIAQASDHRMVWVDVAL